MGRLAELLLCLAAAVVWAPVALATAALGGPLRLRRALRLSQDGDLFAELSLALPEGRLGRWAGLLGVQRLPTLLNVLRGQMAWVGPRALTPGEGQPRDARQRERGRVSPGLVGLWRLRQRANVAYGSELESDLEYVASRSPQGDAGLLARAAVVRTLGASGGPPPAELRILGLRLDNPTLAESLQRILGWLDAPGARCVAFVNADCANLAARSEPYRQSLLAADLVLADGIGVRLAGQLLGQPVRENVNGTDLFPRLCADLADGRHGVYLLGGRPGVAEGVRDWLARERPGVRVVGCRHGYFDESQTAAVAAEVGASGAALLLVALGAPRQELWLRRHLAATGARVGMGVGGLFDFYSGRIPRAPAWMRELGLEWLFRFWQEPHRMWRRYFVGNVVFLARVLRERRGARARQGARS